MSGELGSGKTTFTRFFLKALGYKGLVKSPTYTLFESYKLTKYHIFHLDLYRLKTPKEMLEIGLYDEFDRIAIWIIEWPEHAFPFLPTPDIQCVFTLNTVNRQAEIKPQTPAGRHLLKKIENLS